ncbi:MAG: hypothetical protein ACE5IZ_02960 [Dehalococcoidia bacterium]
MSGKPLLVIRVHIEPSMLTEFERWYHSVHLQNMLKIPGVVAAYRLSPARVGTNWVAVFKFDNEAALQEAFNSAEASRARQAWQQWMPHISEMSVEVYAALTALPPYHHWN